MDPCTADDLREAAASYAWEAALYDDELARGRVDHAWFAIGMDYFNTLQAVVALDDELVAAPTDQRAARIRVARAATHAAHVMRSPRPCR